MSLYFFAFKIVSLWFIFVKAGEEGWKAIIPYYNSYIQFKIAGKKNLWPGYLVIMILMNGMMLLGDLLIFIGALDSEWFGILGIGVICLAFSGLLSIPYLILYILMNISLGHKFGLKGGFIAGMILLNTIFFGILAFDKRIVYETESLDTIGKDMQD